MARLVLFSFLLTFIASRVTVYLIMARTIPDLYLHLGGNHICAARPWAATVVA